MTRRRETALVLAAPVLLRLGVLLLERAKLVVEGAGAASVAALLGGQVPGDGPAEVILSGGNIDAHRLAEILEGRVPD